MKKIIIFLFLIIIRSIPMIAGVTINGLYYTFMGGDGEAQVAGCSISGDIVIPEEINYEKKVYKVTGIAMEAFKDCVGVTSITVPNGVCYIDIDAFSGCTGLKSIYISKSVTNINFGVFSGCSELSTIIVEEGNPKYDSRNNCNALIETANNIIIKGSNNTVIPNSVTAIGERAFVSCAGLTSIVIPNSVTDIAFDAFYGCSNLTSVTLSSNLERVTGFGATGLISVDIPEGVKEIGMGGFSRCKSLTSVTIPKTVNKIEGFAFHSCSSLPSVTIPEKVTSIGSQAFAGCNSLEKVYCYTENVPFTSLDDPFPFRDTDLSKTVLYVNDALIDEYITKWPGFKDYVGFDNREHKLTFYVDDKEYKSYNLKYGERIPECTPTKKGHTFSGWSSTYETMPYKDVNIYGSFSLSKITTDMVIYQVVDTLNNYASVIGNDKASGAITILSAIDFDCTYNVTVIDNRAFYGCSNITTVDIPTSITKIGERAFAGIDKLSDITIMAEDVPVTDRTVFENSYVDYVTLHVPYASLDKYKAVGPWKDFKEIVAIEGTQRTFVLTYKVDGEVYKTYETKEGEAIAPEPEPIKEGYTFSGWSEIPAVMPSEDLTITGTFTINKYKLTYIVDDKEYKMFEVEYNAAITPEPAPEKEGYTFSGWGEIPEKMPAKDVIVTGAFTINKYKLTYMVDGEVYKTIDVEYGAMITPEAAPIKEGYTFSGWSDIPTTMPANDVEVTGSFAINKYNLIYKVDGEVYKKYEIEYGAEIIPEEEPTKEGYTFSGWSWIPKKMPAEDVIITGTFTQIEYDVDGSKYIIDDDEATIVDGGDAEGEVVVDATITINGKTYKVTVIGEGAYQGNNKITSVDIPDGIETILANSFYNCGGINTLKIGKTIKYIGSKAFGNIWTSAVGRRASDNPLTIECYAESVPEVDADCFIGTPIANAVLLVEDALVDSYKAISPWCYFGEIKGFHEASGIDNIFVGRQNAAIYSIDGQRLDAPRKGMNIIKTSQGIKKVMVK